MGVGAGVGVGTGVGVGVGEGVGVGLGPGVGVGVGDGPPAIVTFTTAPALSTDNGVIVTPAAESVYLRPTVSAASVIEEVSGVISSRKFSDPTPSVFKVTRTPFIRFVLDDIKLSNPIGRRSST